MKKLVIVESPAKANTIGRFLGKEYEVLASFGHIRDLVEKKSELPEEVRKKEWADLGVDTDSGYKPYYKTSSESKKHVAELRKAVKGAGTVVLATDEDREGEAISWHLQQELKLPPEKTQRIVFHEITRDAIDEAIANPRQVDMELVEAQESRRILDRLFGYRLSPVLWRKVQPGLSSGRVQSVALRLVVEREEERRAFRTAAYWDIEAQLEAEAKPFTAALVELDGKRLASSKYFDAATGGLTGKAQEIGVVWLREDNAQVIAGDLAKGGWTVEKVEQKPGTLKPQAPFITSTLQQAASSLLSYAPRRTMQIAQRLYEGVDLGNGEREGLITYMRTDSVTLSSKAIGQAGHVIESLFGKDYHQVRMYKSKTKNAQEAHEAIRPTDLSRRPEQVAGILSKEELALYRIIWNRTLASQMAEAKLLKTTVEFGADTTHGRAKLRANGSVVTFKGFLAVADSGQKDTELPSISEGQMVLRRAEAEGKDHVLTLDKTEPVAHETKPPARYTEAALVKALEDEGIGRPSTYASIIGVIQDRKYVFKKGNALAPSFLGVAVILLLRKHFGDYIDYQFTARMEDALDEISRGERDGTNFLDTFYKGNGNGGSEFGPGLKPTIEAKMEEIEFPRIPIGTDANSGEPIVVRMGKKAPFIQRGEGGRGNTAPIPEDITYEDLTEDIAVELIGKSEASDEPLGHHPETGQPIYAKVGPYGPYVQLGDQEEGSKKKPKRASLPKGKDIDEVSLELALKHLSLPRELGQHPETGNKVKASIGPYGPYVECNKEYRSLKPEAGDDVFSVTLERAVELLKQPKPSRQRQKTVLKTLGEHPESNVTVEVCDGRYGPYVTDGKKNATIPKDEDPQQISLERAVALLAEAPAKKKRAAGKKKAASKKRATG